MSARCVLKYSSALIPALSGMGLGVFGACATKFARRVSVEAPRRGRSTAFAPAYCGYVANAGRHRLVGSCRMARHDRRAVRTELRPPPSRLSRGRGGGLRGTTLDIPSVDNCCSEHSDTSGQSGARAPLNAIVSTRLTGAPSTSHARSLGTVTRSPAGCGSEELPQIGGKHAC
jgi:hypothetical protein